MVGNGGRKIRFFFIFAKKKKKKNQLVLIYDEIIKYLFLFNFYVLGKNNKINKNLVILLN